MSWLAVGAVVVSAVGTGVAVYGQQQQAKAAESAAKYNAELQRQQAAQENAVAAENSRRMARESAKELARVRAASAASGLAMEGTPLAVLGESAMMLERDIQDLAFDASNRSRALIAGASMSLWEGKQQASALRTQSYATALQGASSASSGYLSSTGKV